MSSSSDILVRYKQAKEQVAQLHERVKATRAQKADATVGKVAQELGLRPLNPNLTCVRNLRGHTGKVYALAWAAKDPTKIVSASQDGRLLVWNAFSGVKTHAIKLVSAWVMTCAFSPDGGVVAAGGLDNVCSIYELDRRTERDGNVQASRMLAGHKGYVSCCRFVDGQHILTSSGDRTCILWDVRSNARLHTFGGDTATSHQSDVMSVSVSPQNSAVFVSGSCDSTAKLWDTRSHDRALMTFHGHTMDVNAVQFLPNGFSFGTGSDDGSCRVFDIRSGHELMKYVDPLVTTRTQEGPPMSVTSIAFSYSGRLLFASYSNNACHIWDVATGVLAGEVPGHHNRVSCLAVAADGMALATGCWDNDLRVFAVNRR